MAQAQTPPQPTEFRFANGILTEVNLLDFPEGASVDEVNFNMNTKGERTRRFGMDFEDSAVYFDTGLTENELKQANITTYLWNNADNDSDVSLIVVAIENTLWFFDAGATNTSGNQKNSGSTVELTGGDGQPLQFAAVAGDLYIANGSQSVQILSYNSGTDTVTLSQARIKIRDLFGVQDNLEVSERPTTLTNEHNYNLRNQGWPQYWEGTQGGDKDPVVSTNTYRSFYPSNGDIWHLALIFDADDNINRYLSKELVETTGESAKGHYVIDAFNRGASRATIAARDNNLYTSPLGLPEDTSTGGVAAVAAFAGRVWYAVDGDSLNGDDESPYLNTFVFYSQTVDSLADATKCYTQNDPTDKDISDLLDTDGGFVRIPEARGIHTLVPLENAMIVIAKNGVWAIQGGDAGFSATEQAVTKVAATGCISNNTVVNADGTIFYFGESGVSVISTDATSLAPKVENISERTIQSLYNDIPTLSKQYAKGYYDRDLRTVRWLYNTGEAWYGANNGDWLGRYNAELVLNLMLPAWSKNSITDDGTQSNPVLSEYVQTSDFNNTRYDELVYDRLGVVVTDAAAADVTVDRGSESSAISRRKHLALVYQNNRWEFSFSFFRNANFIDWPNQVANDAAAYVVTGYASFGDSTRYKRGKYLTVHCRRTEDGYVSDGNGGLNFTSPSSCKVQAQWEWTDTVTAGRWSDEFQAYRFRQVYTPSGASDPFDYSYQIVTTKNKLRGRGRALSLKFSSEPQKDLQLLGWSADIHSNQVI